MRGGHASVGVIAAQAVEDEIVELARIGLHALGGQHLVGPGEQCLQVQLEPALDDRPRQPQRGAPQRERILVAGRLQPRGEAPGQRVQALGDRQHLAQWRRGDGVGGEARAVGLVDRQRDRVGFARLLRVVAAGDALQFRELAHHPRLQVVLRQHRRAPGLRGIGTDQGGHGLGQCRHPHHLVGHAAQLRLEGDAGQALAHRRQPLLEVLVEEEARVGEPRSDHALVALADFPGILRFDIGDADEVLRQAALRIQHREELLVGFHRLDQGFLRHRQEVALERAGHRHRPFVEAVDLLQVARLDPRGAAAGAGGAFDLGDDPRAALVGVDQYPGAPQCSDILLRPRDRQRLGRVEPVAAGVAPGADAKRRHRGDLVAQQHHQPVHRTCEAVGVAAPAHRLGNRHARQRFVDHLLQQVERARAGLHRAMHETLALVVAGFLQRGPGDAGLGGEAFQRPGRLAVGIQRDVQVRTEHFGRLLRLFAGHARQQHRQVARRIQRLRIAALDRNPALVQRRDHAIEKGLRQSRQRLDRQFLGAQLDQQRLHAHAATAGASCFSPGKPSFSRWAK